VSLDVDAEATGARYAPEVEAAVYFCVLEALQNCAKHAPDAAVRVSLSSTAEWLRFAIADHGPGFEPDVARRGSGLQGMADRVAALGGTLHVQSAPGQGTTVTAGVPVGAHATALVS
jgi:signal transduction histidine kinase